jgi:ABC-2 type transport system ATP-binding protein
MTAEAPNGAAVRVERLSQRYRRGFWLRTQTVLADLALELPRGGRLALLGPNGSGKSTLLRLLMGLERPSSGAITVLGHNPRLGSVRRQLGYAPDGAPFPQQVPLINLLSTVARLHGLGAAQARRLAHQRLERFGLGQALKQELGKCSLGMRRRFVLAQCFLVPRELYLLDEPSAGLDVLGQELLAEELEQALARGASLVIASHEGAEWARWAEQLLLLVAGRVQREGPLQAVLEECDAIEAEWHGPKALSGARAAAAEQGLLLQHARPAPELLRRWYRAALARPSAPGASERP